MNEIEIKIKNLAKSKGISIRKLCKLIEITEQGLSRSFKKKTMKIETLQKISNVLSIPISTFFCVSEVSISKFTDDERFLIMSALIKNKIPDELVKKIWNLDKR